MYQVFHRNRTNRIDSVYVTHVYMFICNEIYYKELAHVIMEAEKFQDLRSGSCRRAHARESRSGKTDSIVPVHVQRPENQESRGSKF